MEIDNTAFDLDRGMAHLREGNFDAAIADFNKAISVGSYYISAYNYLMSFAVTPSLFARHTDYVKQGINPFEHGFGFGMPSNKIYQGHRFELVLAIRAYSGLAYAYKQRGDVKRSQNDRTSAIADYKEALRIIPDYPDSQELKDYIQLM